MKQQAKKNNVGPGSYEQHLRNKQSGPKYSLAGRIKSHLKETTPGAGAYNIP